MSWACSEILIKGKVTPMASRKSSTSGSSIPIVRPGPLDDAKREAFVIVYRDSFDGPLAARAAGYEDPDRIWTALLAREDVQERLRGYQLGTDPPAPSAGGIGKLLYTNLVKTDRSIVSRDFVTGALCLDPAKALAEDPFVTFEQTIEDRGGITQRRTRLRTSDPIHFLNILTSKPELLERATGAAVDPFVEAFKELVRRGSKAPVVKIDPEQRPPPAKGV